MVEGGLSDEELLKRLSAIYGEAFVAGVAKELAEYRWSSYGEAVGGGSKGNGKKAREGLIRAYFCDQGIAKMLRCRIRYFTDGAVIGSKEFVNEAFESARDRFGPKRKDGARKLKGEGAAAGRTLWSLRDLRKGIA